MQCRSKRTSDTASLRLKKGNLDLVFGISLLFFTACTLDTNTSSSIRPDSFRNGNVQTLSHRPATFPVHCPSNLRVLLSNGVELVYLGNDPNDPEICVLNSVGRGTYGMIFGITIGYGPTFFHSSLNQEKSSLRSLFPLSPNKSASYILMRTDGAWRRTWRVLGQQQITVPAGTFDTHVIELIEEGQFSNTFRGEQIQYIDRQTGLPVRVDSRIVRGLGNWPSWVAIKVEKI